jgi:hypothetical protein
MGAPDNDRAAHHAVPSLLFHPELAPSPLASRIAVLYFDQFGSIFPHTSSSSMPTIEGIPPDLLAGLYVAVNEKSLSSKLNDVKGAIAGLPALNRRTLHGRRVRRGHSLLGYSCHECPRQAGGK